jgi:hypothetical protein
VENAQILDRFRFHGIGQITGINGSLSVFDALILPNSSVTTHDIFIRNSIIIYGSNFKAAPGKRIVMRDAQCLLQCDAGNWPLLELEYDDIELMPDYFLFDLSYTDFSKFTAPRTVISNLPTNCSAVLRRITLQPASLIDLSCEKVDGIMSVVAKHKKTVVVVDNVTGEDADIFIGSNLTREIKVESGGWLLPIGNGTLVPLDAKTGKVERRYLEVDQDSHVIVTTFSVKSQVMLFGGTVTAGKGTGVGLGEQLAMEVRFGRWPTLNLGENYAVVPDSLLLFVNDENLSDPKLRNVKHTLVTGLSEDACNVWSEEFSVFPASLFEIKCQFDALVVESRRGIPWPGPSVGHITSGRRGSGGVFAGIAVGGAVVVVCAVVGVVVCVKKRGKGENGGSLLSGRM